MPRKRKDRSQRPDNKYRSAMRAMHDAASAQLQRNLNTCGCPVSACPHSGRIPFFPTGQRDTFNCPEDLFSGLSETEPHEDDLIKALILYPGYKFMSP